MGVGKNWRARRWRRRARGKKKIKREITYNQILLTTFLHTAVGVSRVIQCSKAKSELIRWRRNFKRHKLLHWQLKQNSTKAYYNISGAASLSGGCCGLSISGFYIHRRVRHRNGSAKARAVRRVCWCLLPVTHTKDAIFSIPSSIPAWSISHLSTIQLYKYM